MAKAKQQLTGCDACPLNSETTRVPGAGPETASLVVIGEAPGQQERRHGKPFVGPAGKELDVALKQAGINRDEIYLTNALLCMPPGKPPTPPAKAITCCKQRLLEEVRSRHPQVVLALGKTAAKALLGINQPIDDLRGSIRQVDSLGARVVVAYHPAYILRNPRLHRDLVNDLAKAKLLLENPESLTASIVVEHTVLQDLESLDRFLTITDKPWFSEVALDVETASDGSLLCLGLSLEQEKAVVIPNYLIDAKVARWLNYWLLRRTVVAHNGKFDLKVLRSCGITTPLIGADTMLESYVLNPLVGGHGLKQLVRENLGFYEDYAANVDYKHMENMNPDEMYRYNAYDAALTLMLHKELSKRLDSNDRRVLNNLLYPGANALLDMECLGVAVDREYLTDLDLKLTHELEQLEHQLCREAGMEFNPRSTKQLMDVMFRQLDLPIPGRFSTDKKALAILKKVANHPVLELLERYRERQRFHSTYVRALLKASEADGRAHTNFNLHTTVTGRLSSSDPVNLQNQPRTSEARNIFVASPGYTLVECDLSAAEVRGWGYYSRDEAMRHGIVDLKLDPHVATASLLWGLKPEEITDAQRQKGKRSTFAQIYGQETKTLAGELGIPVDEAADLQRRLFQAYPQGRRWIMEQQQRVGAEHMFVTPYGRRLLFVDDPNDRSAIYRDAVNYPIQSLASDIALSGLIETQRLIKHSALGKTRLLLTVHDSVMVETKEDPQEVANVICKVIQDGAAAVLGDFMPFAADAKAGKSWGNMRKLA